MLFQDLHCRPLRLSIFLWGGEGSLFCLAVYANESRIHSDLHPHEQTAGPGPLLNALRNLISCVKLKNVKTRLERLTPEFKSFVSQNAATMRDILLPQIQLRFSDTLDSKNQKTVIDLAIKDFKKSGQQPTPEFINILTSNLKAFLFAGHDTTAQTMLVYLDIFFPIESKIPHLQELDF